MITGINNRANGVNVFDSAQRGEQVQDRAVSDAEKLSNKSTGNEDAEGGSIHEKGHRLKADEYVRSEEPASESDSEEKVKSSRCTVNTDKVDREIKKLKKKQTELKQQIAKAPDNPQEAERLKKQLEKVSQELKMKDNDTYRRQHAQYTQG